VPRAPQQPLEPEETPCEGSGRDPPPETEHAATAEWPEHCKACVEA